MNSRTKQLKQRLTEVETVEEKFDLLKNTYSDCKAVILAPGPSLNDYDLTCLYDRNDIVILSIKQAQDKVVGQSDFHIVNTYNFDKYNGYTYGNLDCIIFYGLSQSFIQAQTEKLAIKPHPVDLWIPVVNPPTISYQQSIHKSADYDKFFMLEKETKTWWGTSILYEQAIPMSLLIGCKEIVTIGWDLGTGTHSYRENKARFKVDSADIERTQDSINTTPELYDWLVQNSFELKICSSSNPADKRFERIEPWQI
tara:strand:+ start:2190 stop:2951 length:762 start_codon:yes stop_codon:yes gene_type:complete